MNQSLIAILKEIGRLILFSLPGALILLYTENPELAGAWGIPILYVLRAVDKGIHENENIKANGLAPF